ncbi:protein of unknown function [Methylocaldum szegediense]|uniref:PIN domain-containing protein n=1 Tax=Methylocaldum szegediense TaxID=73780 RepID=A0ABM9HWE6_9GAMM|nr:protein of unknown function [Methylocaldum szegediense]
MSHCQSPGSTLEQITEVIAESFLADHEHSCDSQSVWKLAASSWCRVYDCDFVTLARELGMPLVTEDFLVPRCSPDTAKTTQAFLEVH